MKKPKHWQAIYGKFAFENDQVHFRGNLREIEGQASIPGDGLAMCDLVYSGGTICATVAYSNVLEAPWAQIVLFRNPIDNSLVTAGLQGAIGSGSPHARFIVYVYDARDRDQTRYRSSYTTFVEVPPTRELTLKVFSMGSLIDLYADDVHMLRHFLEFSPPPSQCGLYCRGSADVQISDFSVDSKSRSAFVIMKFSPPFEDLFKQVIKPVALECGVDAEKADDILGPGMIISDITNRLKEADIVIADISVENANVYYELGYAHAIGKPTILLAEKGKTLPFDISGFRTLFYENSIAGKSQIEEGLRKHLSAIIQERPL
jgi:hypothetical protein